MGPPIPLEVVFVIVLAILVVIGVLAAASLYLFVKLAKRIANS